MYILLAWGSRCILHDIHFNVGRRHTLMSSNVTTLIRSCIHNYLIPQTPLITRRQQHCMYAYLTIQPQTGIWQFCLIHHEQSQISQFNPSEPVMTLQSSLPLTDYVRLQKQFSAAVLNAGYQTSTIMPNVVQQL